MKGNRPASQMNKLEAAMEAQAALFDANNILRGCHTPEAQDARDKVNQALGCMRLVTARLDKASA